MCAPFDLLPYGGIFGHFSPGFGPLCLAQNLCLKLSLVFIVIRLRRVHLRKRQMRVLHVHLFRVGAMRQLVHATSMTLTLGSVIQATPRSSNSIRVEITAAIRRCLSSQLLGV